jgi:GNAT superfamily N-acetyltransferase
VIIRTAVNEQEIAQSLEVYWANDPPPDSASKASAIAHWLAIYASCPEGFWIAEDEAARQIVGVAAVVRRPPQWILANFYVLPSYQGQGLGRRLLAQAFATREGCERFAVHASVRPSAQSLYMQFGMYPQPYSIELRGNSQNHPGVRSELVAEACPAKAIVSTLNSFDQEALGFTRAVDHLRWGEHGSYFLVKDQGQVIGYFRVSPERRIGPSVVSDRVWIPDVLDLAARKQWELSPGDQEILVPGANTTALAHLLAHGYRYEELELLLSSHRMSGLSQVLFHDVDFL